MYWVLLGLTGFCRSNNRHRAEWHLWVSFGKEIDEVEPTVVDGTGYIIFYTTDGTLRDRDWVVEGVVGDKMTVTIKGLTPDTTYFLKIQARNNKGYGPFSSVIQFRTNPGTFFFCGFWFLFLYFILFFGFRYFYIDSHAAMDPWLIRFFFCFLSFFFLGFRCFLDVQATVSFSTSRRPSLKVRRRRC